jgi:ribosomal protein L29
VGKILQDLIGPGGLIGFLGAVGLAVKWLTSRRDAQMAALHALAEKIDAERVAELAAARAEVVEARAADKVSTAEKVAEIKILRADNERLYRICYRYISQMLRANPPLTPDPPDPHEGELP